MFNIIKAIKLIIFNISIFLFIPILNYLHAEQLDIYTYESKDNVRVLLNSSALLLSNVFILDNPPRLVIDLKNINNFSKNNSSLKYIKQIRASKKNKTSRLVFDLKAPIINLSKNYIIKQNGDHVLIINLKINTQSFSNNTINSKIIVIDAGHGGADPGAIRNNIKEKDLTLMAAKILKNKLEKRSFTVFLTRKSDYYIRLKNRVKYARSKSPDLFISSLDNTVGMKNLIGVSLALLIGFSHAACPNQCSGHGTCGVDEVVSETLLNRMVLLFDSLHRFPSSPFFLCSLSKSTHAKTSALAIPDGELVEMLEVIAPTAFVLMN